MNQSSVTSKGIRVSFPDDPYRTILTRIVEAVSRRSIQNKGLVGRHKTTISEVAEHAPLCFHVSGNEIPLTSDLYLLI